MMIWNWLLQGFFLGRSEFARHFLDGVSVTDILLCGYFCWQTGCNKHHRKLGKFTTLGKVQFRKNFVECGKRALPWSVSGFLGRVNIVIISLLDLSISNDLSFAVKLDWKDFSNDSPIKTFVDVCYNSRHLTEKCRNFLGGETVKLFIMCFHGRWLHVVVRSSVWSPIQVVDGKQMIYGKSPGVPVFLCLTCWFCPRVFQQSSRLFQCLTVDGWNPKSVDR